MVDLFQERYRELPAFQKALELVSEYDGGFYTKEEFATRILMLNEDALNWGTLCKNCGVLMDDNYAQYIQIQQLQEQIAHPVIIVCGICGRRKDEEHYCNPDF